MTDEPTQQPITFGESTQQPLVFEPQNIVMTEEKREQNRKALAHLGRTGEQLEENARLWQSEAFNIWIGLENKRMGTKVATGAGKTRLSLAIAHDWLHTEQHHNPVVLFFVPSIKLATQTYNTYRMWGLKVGRIFAQASTNPHQTSRCISPLTIQPRSCLLYHTSRSENNYLFSTSVTEQVK